MKKQKLGLDDFKAVGTSELLKVKGGKTTLLRVGPGGDGGCCCGGQWTSGDFIANGMASDITNFMNDAYDTLNDIGNAAYETGLEMLDNFLDNNAPVKFLTPPFPEYIDPNLMPPSNNLPTTAYNWNGCN